LKLAAQHIMTRHIARLLAVGLPLLAVSCAPDAQLTGAAYLSPPLALDMLTVTVRDGGKVWAWDGSDFRLRGTSGTPTTPVVGTRAQGEIEVRYQLRASGQLLSQGAVVLPLREDWRWGVGIHAATSDPRLLCFGCVGSQAFALAPDFRPPGRDSIWVVWGGNSISHPVIY